MDNLGFGFYVCNTFCLILLRTIFQNPGLKRLLIMFICIVNFIFFSYNDKVSDAGTGFFKDILNDETEVTQGVTLAIKAEPKDQYPNFANNILGTSSSVPTRAEENENTLSFESVSNKENHNLIEISASYIYYIAIIVYIFGILITLNQGHRLSTALHRYSLLMYLQILCLFFQNSQSHSFYNVLIYSVELAIHLIASLLNNTNRKSTIASIVLLICSLAINRFRNPYSITDSFSWFLIYVLPILEFPLLCMIVMSLANNFRSFLDAMMANDFYINTKNKNNKEIFLMVFYLIMQACFLLFKFGCLVYVEMLIEYIHGYRPAMVTLIAGIAYSVPFAYCLEFPKDTIFNLNSSVDMISFNIFPVLFSFYTMKLVLG